MLSTTMDRPLLFLDTETATFDGAPHLLELAAVRVVDGEAVDHFESLVCPQVPIQPEAVEFHGITEDDVRTAPVAAEVLDAFASWAGDEWLAAHNAPADARVLGYEYARAGLEPPSGPFLDTLSLAKRFLPDAPDHRLATLSDHLGLDSGTLHRALADAVCAWQVLEACCTHGAPRSAAGLLAACRAHTTIPGAAPARPRTDRRTRSLEVARSEGAAVQLLYGSPPDALAVLEVRPRLLFRSRKKDYLEAECSRTGVLKTYRLDRIRRVTAL